MIAFSYSSSSYLSLHSPHLSHVRSPPPALLNHSYLNYCHCPSILLHFPLISPSLSLIVPHPPSSLVVSVPWSLEIKGKRVYDARLSSARLQGSMRNLLLGEEPSSFPYFLYFSFFQILSCFLFLFLFCRFSSVIFRLFLLCFPSFFVFLSSHRCWTIDC